MRALRSTLVVAMLAVQPMWADCAFAPGRVIKARILRCEDSAPYVEAAAKVTRYKEPVATEDGLKMIRRTDLATISEEKYPGKVLVVGIEWELRFQPAATSFGVKGVQPEEEWRRVIEHARLWWKGPDEYCNAADKRVIVELWAHSPCCDTLPPMAACLADMDYGETVPESIRSLISEVGPRE